MAVRISRCRQVTQLNRLCQSSLRSYHSYDHPAPPGPFNATETAILSASVPEIPAHGFTTTSLIIGAEKTGHLAASINLFPAGAFSLVNYHLYTQRQALASHVRDLEDKGMGVGGKVKELTWRRLMANKAIVHRWQEALALMAVPSNIPVSLHELHALSDEIWFLSGDVSVDSSWYTKRASLSSIYATTELFMTTDKSANFQDSREFMDRRFEGVRNLGTTIGSVGQWVGFTASASVNVLRSKGVRI